MSEQSQGFLRDRPKDLHEAPPPWHRLAFIVRALPAAIETLALELRIPEGGTVLDYGCADQPYRRLFASHVQYVGADLRGNPLASVEVASDGTVAVPDESFDAVLSTQVLEHVSAPATYLAECQRVLRPGGRMLLSTHGIMVWHPDPVDYWRWTCDGLRRAVSDAGLNVVSFDGIMGLSATGIQLIQDSYYYRVPRRLAPLLALVCQTLIRLVDRFEKPEQRRMNALVFALIAEKPR